MSSTQTGFNQTTEAAFAGRFAVGDGAALSPGELLGEFRIESLVGSGGMGEVYRALQLQPVQRVVAIKRLRARELTASERAWFELERQILAQMQHPAIAQLFDAGTLPDGSPYLVIEFLDGAPLVAHAQSHRLTLVQRLELYLALLDGVAHAHQRGVIHRDLKPSNVLVTVVDGRSAPKIIDFGIASTAATNESYSAGTRMYMAPEQARGEMVDVRADIHALGVMLGELLTELRPDQALGADGRPLPPSRQLAMADAAHLATLSRHIGIDAATLKSRLAFELDPIFHCATAPAAEQRYASVLALKADLQAVLERRPVSVHPGGRWYRWQRFAVRHALPLALSGLALTGLIAGLVLALVGLSEANTQRAVALARQAELTRISAFQQRMLTQVDPAIFGRQLLDDQRTQLLRLPVVDEGGDERRAALERLIELSNAADLARGAIETQLLDRAERAIEADFANEPVLAAQLRRALAEVYLSVGSFARAAELGAAARHGFATVHGPTSDEALGMTEVQVSALFKLGKATEALAVSQELRALAASRPADDVVRIEIARWHAEVLHALGRGAEAIAELRALPESGDGQNTVLTDTLRVIQVQLARMEVLRGESASALARVDRAVAGGPQIDRNLPRTWATTYSAALMVYASAGQVDRALDYSGRLYEYELSRNGRDHDTSLSALNTHAATLVLAARYDEAIAALRELVESSNRLRGPRHPASIRALNNLSSALHRRASAEPAVPDPVPLLTEARAGQRQVLQLRREMLGADHIDTLSAGANLGRGLIDDGAVVEAEAVLKRSLDGHERLYGPDHINTAAVRSVYADALEALGQRAESLAEQRRVLAVRESALKPTDNQTIGTALTLYRLSNDEAERRALRSRLLEPYMAASANDPTQKSRRAEIEAALKSGAESAR